MSFRRHSAFRGRSLRFDEALLEKFAMSSAGYQYLLYVAPRIDRVVIPRNSSLSASSV